MVPVASGLLQQGRVQAVEQCAVMSRGRRKHRAELSGISAQQQQQCINKERYSWSKLRRDYSILSSVVRVS